MSSKPQSRRKKRRNKQSPMPLGGAGLMRFFEDSSIGVKIGPISAVLLASALIGIVLLGHFGIFDWVLTPAGGGG